ncbi:sulfotransferase family protein [Dyella acidiphila]|uniref:Sulfotransferase family protein n=1 Tax=Dyella acidiphila TaxID=2775866 RepID=A0ABR9GFS5_9GAMM|nr:hypothetical protein [Dyella acidiphila]MBE1162903.1 hypothetical protein [Dyella acidiphila]
MSASPPRRKALLILGMHRSGTSAVTRVVNLLGANIGRNILPPGAGNSEGFWEHADAMLTNHYLLESFGRSWFDIRRLPPHWLQRPEAQNVQPRIRRIISDEFAASTLVAVKDPRMCLTAPAWIDAFRAMGYEVQCLLVVRDPREVAASLQAREPWMREPAYLLWAHYMVEAVLAARECPRALITYDQLLGDWRATMQRVAGTLALTWPRAEAAASSDIDSFLHAGHRHHRARPEHDSALPDNLPPFVAEFYRHCLALAQARSDWQALDQAALNFRSVSELYSTHLDQVHAREQELTKKLLAYEELLKNIAAKIQPKS